MSDFWHTGLTYYQSLSTLSLICNTHQNYLIKQLESAQYIGTRFIAQEYCPFSSLTRIKSDLNSIPLEIRRKMTRLCVFS